MTRGTGRLVRLALAGIVASCCVPSARAQGTSSLPADDVAYHDLDQLDALGIVDSMVVGQRPYSYREMGRLARIARRNLSRIGASRDRALAESLLGRLERRFAIPEDGHVALPEERLSTGVSSTNSLRRRPFGTFGGEVEATIDPLADRRLGAAAPSGQVATLELSQRFEPSSAFALNALYRAEAHDGAAGSPASRSAEVLLAGARTRYRNLAVMVGREQLAWSQSEGDGLFLASNAPALDQISLSGDQPFRLPWFASRWGPAQGTLVIADLGPSVVHSGSRLVAYKMSLLPSPDMEFGATFMNHFGGVGSRPTDIRDRVIDLLPFVDLFRRHNYTDSTRAFEVESDKLLGVDGRLRAPWLGGLSFRGEWLIDDFDVHRLSAIFSYDASHSVRMVLPRLWDPGSSLEIFAKHTGIRTYTHGQLQDGITTRGRLLGDELGPNAKAFGALLGWWSSVTTHLSLEGRHLIYSDADYRGGYTDSTDVHFFIRTTDRRPDEVRDDIIASSSMQRGDHLVIRGRAGLERTRSGVTLSLPRTAYVADLSLSIRP